jgi:hypothetical protein
MATAERPFPVMRDLLAVLLIAASALLSSRSDAAPGTVIPATDIKIDTTSAQWHCTYSLPESCLVRVRCGIAMGPLLKTLQDWKIQAAGKHQIPLELSLQDESLLVDPDNIVVSVLTCALPSNFELGRDAADGFNRLSSMSRQPQRDAIPPARAANLSPFWRSGLSKEPDFEVTFPGAAQTPHGTLLLTAKPRISITTSDRVRTELSRPTGELTVYVDFNLLSEEDAPGGSEVKTIDLSACPPGEHILTLNLRDPGGNVGARSYRFEVRPADELERMRPPDDSKPQP